MENIVAKQPQEKAPKKSYAGVVVVILLAAGIVWMGLNAPQALNPGYTILSRTTPTPNPNLYAPTKPTAVIDVQIAPDSQPSQVWKYIDDIKAKEQPFAQIDFYASNPITDRSPMCSWFNDDLYKNDLINWHGSGKEVGRDEH